MKWQGVKSSNLKAAAYDQENEYLYIKFHSKSAEGKNRVYQYNGVQLTKFKDLMNPNIVNKGWYHRTFIENYHLCQEVTNDID